ncbi:MAG: NAD-dependent epimerase/dehydratase family protein [candidate division CPR1 bacterium GW2011_GWA2_42_17]|uniref:NAD-dependent epimerase/dehydratase family protein n=1 Tax=candidate division CPR1 bacterium GW2011_GWA2_42_17 TaxID=1618341 RepID=A0A0G0Z710_9BACT|nr:MAG: NAD-dependent epimerase/dehydratase family protein [candidate division CPR1 bacterium GW2011_GWA2_42_17]
MAEFDRENILIAGGAGFIGSHLCSALLPKHNVICVDNFVSSEHRNIEFLLQSPNFEFVKADLSEILKLENLPELEKFHLRGQGLQQIYNCACPSSLVHYDAVPIETIKANSVVVINLLEMAASYKARLVHCSSACVYGSKISGKDLLKENDLGVVDQLGPRSAYNEGKRFAESLVINYRDYKKVQASAARIFNTYGPRMNHLKGRMIPQFIEAALTGKELVIYGDENTTVSNCFISDLIDGLTRLLNHNEDRVINLGNPIADKAADVANLVIKLTNSNSHIVFQAPPPYITLEGAPDISEAKEMLGWFPLVSLEDGLKQTIADVVANQALK